MVTGASHQAAHTPHAAWYNAGGGSDVWQMYDAHAIVFRSSRGCGVTLRVRVASAARRYWASRALSYYWMGVAPMSATIWLHVHILVV